MHHAVLRAYAVLAAVSSCCPPVQGRLSTRYSPVRHSVTSENITSFDLHVLSTPPALILSQDRTLMFKSPDPVRLKLSFFSFRYCVASISRWLLGSFTSIFRLLCSNVLNNPRGFSTSVSFETFKRIFRVGYTV